MTSCMLLLNLFLCPSCRETQEQPREEGAPPAPANRSAGGTKVAESITTATDQHRHMQQLSKQQRPSHPHSRPQNQQRGAGLLQPPQLPRLHSQHFSAGPMLGPLTALGGIRGLLGPAPVWQSGLGPTGAGALVWGFQPTGRDFNGPRLLGGYHSSAGQSSSRYRGGQRGGGFNGM